MRILLVEDEPTLNLQIGRSLRAEGYIVEVAVNGRDALHLGNEEDFDAVVLDLGLPLLDGISVLKRWRANGRGMPVLILTARGDWHERVAGIDAGADDYLVKPFELEELVARVFALRRRTLGWPQSELCLGALRVDPRKRQVKLANQEIHLSDREFRLLMALIEVPGVVLSITQLEERLYGWGEEIASNSIEVQLHRLRKKLGKEWIRNIRGIGFKLVEPA